MKLIDPVRLPDVTDSPVNVFEAANEAVVISVTASEPLVAEASTSAVPCFGEDESCANDSSEDTLPTPESVMTLDEIPEIGDIAEDTASSLRNRVVDMVKTSEELAVLGAVRDSL